jgi:DNA-binding transcriptional MerR regulator
MNNEVETSVPTYRIGAVSRLTGISAEALRMWERRYGVVTPSRSGGRNRLYTREDIGRLALLKRLVDAGDAIGSIAHLTLAQLQERLQIHKAQGSVAADEQSQDRPRPRVIVLGDALPALIAQGDTELQGIDIVAVCRQRAQLDAEFDTLRPDILVLEYPTVHQETVSDVRALIARFGASRALVVYGFGAQGVVRQLDTSQITPLRAPVNLPELRQALLTGNHPTAEDRGGPMAQFDAATALPIPPRRYPSESLTRIAMASTTVQCECPHHLVELIRSLTAFEAYSAECRNTSSKDAALHGFLETTTAQARSLMESALAHVVESEKLDMTKG